MKQRWIALALTLALLLSVCGVSALAGQEPAAPQDGAEVPAEGTVDTPETDTEAASGEDGDGDTEGDAQETPVSPAGPGGEAEGDTPWSIALEEKAQKVVDQVSLSSEPLDAIAFEDLETRIREQSLALRILEERVLLLEEMDYDKLYEDLRIQLNEIAGAQWTIVTMPDAYMSSYEKDKSYEQLKSVYDRLRETFDAIKDGELQKDNAAALWQLNSMEDQIVLGGETLYVVLAGMELQEADLQRKLTALNRTVEEMELRYQLGQISALALSQTKAGQAAAASGLETLRMNLSTYKMQLESLLGAQLRGSIGISAVPEVTERELADLDVERDLLTAKANSYALHEAALTLADAKETYNDAGGDGYPNPTKLDYQQAKRTWNSARFTYNSTVQDFELKFRTLYAQVLDCYQIHNSAKVSLASQQQSFQSSELKYQQGTLSQNAYLDAKDALAAAEAAVESAANQLFSTYNTYCWAVRHGILN